MSTSSEKPKTSTAKSHSEPKTNGADMADEIDVLLKICEMQWGFARQTEDQRAQITNIVLLITSVVIGFIAQKGLSFDVLPLTVLLIALGIYGAVASEKLYERFGFFRARIDVVEKKLDKLRPGAELLKLWQDAHAVNAREFPRLNKLRLHHLWLVLHLGIAVTGIILTAFVVFVSPRFFPLP